ncbi:hypothetical protein [Paraflavitalea sp. CAU 1676]|uniref:hypothetical protein n=1 Tax=Paraflavitalea sp. CAU 1676 TaxID=3032598 RepID=UPI0023DBCCEF|nr:hypothetical protein [Paraflavitalea sp. CAU 1676]MDF2188695.1 hypothetical protein [Paraflavitalea sp. CAU 1676]
MFQSILIRPNSTEGVPMDFGMVIENMFFYQSTTVHINRAAVSELVKLAAPEVLEELLKYQGLKILYNNSMPTVGMAGDGTYWVDTLGLADFDIEKELYAEALRVTGDESKAGKFSKKIARHIGVHELPFTIKTSMVEQLQDKDFLRVARDETLKEHYPGIIMPVGDRRYEIEFLSQQFFRVHTNLQGAADQSFGETSPVLSLINATADLHVTASSGSEICLPEFSSRVLRQKIDAVLDRSQHSAENLSRFHLAQFNESWAIRDAINSKRLHVKAVLPALRKAARFKEWLRDLPENHDLMYEYQEKVEEKTVLERIGWKDMRFYFFTGLQTITSAIAPVASLLVNPAIGVFDAYVIDQIAKEWKPNQFVRGPYKKLLQGR